MTIAFTGSDRARGESIASATSATFFACHEGDRAGTDEALDQALAVTEGRLDVLVTNSQAVVEGSIEATPEADFRRIVEVNLTAAFRAARACFGAMRSAGGGSMIHVGSAAGIRAVHEAAAYSVTSAGLIAVAELLAAEGARHGIRANAVCPGEAPGLEGLEGLASPVDVASVVAWLASDESAATSGATLRVDGAAAAAMIVDTRT
jgi:NAD(P)-dependent dehydrogenase (short-subunit alcohol dehydrogenase family)